MDEISKILAKSNVTAEQTVALTGMSPRQMVGQAVSYAMLADRAVSMLQSPVNSALSSQMRPN